MAAKRSTSAGKASGRGFGWVPDLPDHRDHLYAAPTQVLGRLPAKVDLRKKCPPIFDQGQLGSCTANAIAAAFEFDEKKQKTKKAFMPSRLFIYYNERAMEGTVASDSGAMIRDGIKSIAKQGVCSEKTWPYKIDDFETKPSSASYQEARKHRAVAYQRLTQSLPQLKGCLASGYPFVFGFTVYESFESPSVAKTGRVPMPTSTESSLGGHAVLAVGFDDATSRFIVRNSWGKQWGMQGYFTLPYEYVLSNDLSDDFWVTRRVSK